MTRPRCWVPLAVIVPSMFWKTLSVTVAFFAPVQRQALAVECVSVDQRGLEAADIEIAAAARLGIDDLDRVGTAVAGDVELRAEGRGAGIHPVERDIVEHQLGAVDAFDLEHGQFIRNADRVVVAGHGHVAEGQAGSVRVDAVVEGDGPTRVADPDRGVVGVGARAVDRQEVADQLEGDVVEHDVGQRIRRPHVEEIARRRAVLDREPADRDVLQTCRNDHRAGDDDAGLARTDKRHPALQRDVLGVGASPDRDRVAGRGRVDRRLDGCKIAGPVEQYRHGFPPAFSIA